MKNNKVISTSNFPARLPIFTTLATVLALERWHAPEWLWGVFGLFFALTWGVAIYQISIQESVDLLGKEDKK